MPAHERINEMWRLTGNREPRQFGSFSSSIKTAIASTRHCSKHPDHFNNVNTCVYEPSASRVLVTWPRAHIYLPVPLKSDGENVGQHLVLTIGKGKKQERRAPLQVRVGTSR